MIDRRNAPDVAHAKAGDVATITVTVDEHHVPRNPRQPYRVWCSDETGRLCLTYFNGREDYLKKLLPPGELRVVSGKIELYQGDVQMTHPDHVVPLEERDSILRVEPVYGLTGGLTQRPLQKAIAAAVERAPELPNGRTPRGARSRTGATGSRRLQRPMRRPSRPTCRRRIRPERGSPSTSCWPASSPSPWCVIIRRPWPVARQRAMPDCRDAFSRPYRSS